MKTNSQFKWVVVLSLVTLILGLAVLAAGETLAVMTFLSYESITFTGVASLAFTTLLVGFIGCGLFIAYGIIKLLVSGKEQLRRIPNRMDRNESLVNKIFEGIRDLQDMAFLSDRAKSLIYRDNELDAIRETIYHDLMKQDYKTAEAIIEQVENSFGYKEEAQRLRQEVNTARQATFDEKIDASVNRIQELLNVHDWSRALREAQRFMELFPDNPKIQALPQRISDTRIKHKSKLLQEYGEAVRKNDIDLGVDLLKKLDIYLTPTEADALKESARGVFRAKLHQLGVQFAICVNDQRWAEAIATGEEIISDFPNSRMASEVQQKLDVLRAKAAAENSVFKEKAAAGE